MLSGVVDKSCKNLIAKSNIVGDLEEIGLALRDLMVSDSKELENFKERYVLGQVK